MNFKEVEFWSFVVVVAVVVAVAGQRKIDEKIEEDVY